HSCACRPCSVSHVTFPSFLSYCSGAHRHLHSFPTRRSSDLRDLARLVGFARGTLALTPHLPSDSLWRGPLRQLHEYLIAAVEERSEEHTSELQSRVDLVCRLLLEKKKK